VIERETIMQRYQLFGAILGVMAAVLATPAFGDDSVIFNSVPAPLPGNVASEGPEAYAFAEIGDAIVLPGGTGGTLTTVTVIMSSWACTSGNWFTAGTCVTKPAGAKFAQPITMNIYTVDDTNPAQPKAGTLLGTVTQTFQIPYRPSSNTVRCASGQQWYSSKDGQCYHGLAVPITFDFASKKISLPSQIVVGVAFNTTSAGPHPLGPLPCRSTAQGCPYDSLNVSTDGDVFFAAGATSGGSPTAASVIDPNGIFFNYISTANACNKATMTGVLADDTVPNNGEPATELCFTGLHPELNIRMNCGKEDQPRCPSLIGGQAEQPQGEGDGG
jgi:hypothetical protein